ESGGLRRRLLQRVIAGLARLAASRMDRMMFQNGDDLAEFVDLGIVHRDKTVQIGATGIDLAEWPVTSFPDRPVTFILVARLLRDKGVGEYVEAARRLRADGAEARFLLVGGLDDNPTAITQQEVDSWVAE